MNFENRLIEIKNILDANEDDYENEPLPNTNLDEYINMQVLKLHTLVRCRKYCNGHNEEQNMLCSNYLLLFILILKQFRENREDKELIKIIKMLKMFNRNIGN